jgi:hypothetical protein
MTCHSESNASEPMSWSQLIATRPLTKEEAKQLGAHSGIAGFIFAFIIVFTLLACIPETKPREQTATRIIAAAAGTQEEATGIREGVKNYRTLLIKPDFQARSLPNQEFGCRLGIDNAFTTLDPDRHKEFVASTRQLIRFTAEQWESLAEAATANIEAQVSMVGPAQSLPLKPIVQLLVLRMCLLLFFPDVQEISHDDLFYLATLSTPKPRLNA